MYQPLFAMNIYFIPVNTQTNKSKTDDISKNDGNEFLRDLTSRQIISWSHM